MKCWYINLAGSEARRAHMEAEAARVGIALERMEAVDGRVLSAAALQAVCPGPGLFKQLRGVEVACVLSHRALWQRIVDGTDAYAAVFEDDVRFGDGVAELLTDTDWIPPDAQLIKLETTSRRVLLRGPTRALPHGRSLWRLRSKHLCTGGYIIARACAAELIERTRTITNPVDHLLFNPELGFADSHTIYQLSPALCIQQVRSPAQFLPHGAAATEAIGLRGKSRHDVPALLREAGRSLAKPLRAVAHGSTAWIFGGRWGVVPFR